MKRRSGFRVLLVSSVLVATAAHPTRSRAQCSAPYFHAKIDFPVGAAGPHGAAAGDFNEDGHTDIAVATTGGGVSVLLGQGGPSGSITFAPTASYTAGSGPIGVATGDFDEDGILDLAVANTNSNTVSILRGQGSGGVGNGTFAAAVNFPAGAGPYRIAIGDFNEDGILDLAVANNKAAQVNVLIGQGTGGVGNGQFAQAVPYSIPNLSTSIASGDFNQDGITDLVATSNYSSVLAVLTGAGSGGVGNGAFLAVYNVPAALEPFVVAVADLNDDGFEDLIAGDGGSRGVAVMLGMGAGAFASPAPYHPNLQSAGLVVADYNGDGVPDLAAGDAVNAIMWVSLGNGAGGFGAPVGYPVGATGFPLVGALLNDDDAMDIVCSNYTASSISVLLGTCLESSPPPPPSAAAPTVTAVRDVPNDQGGHVFVTWQASGFDVAGRSDIRAYRVWRRIPAGIGAALALRSPTKVMHSVSPDGSTIDYWESLADLPAQKFAGYGYTAATTQDSMSGSNPYTLFLVIALTNDAATFYTSNVDSGYSVDNIPPGSVSSAEAQWNGSGVLLRWPPSRDDDVTAYRVYRGSDPAFHCDAAHRLADVEGLELLDSGASGADYYKLTAVDRHENEGPALTIDPARPISGGAAAAALELSGTWPNPATTRDLSVEFSLPSRQSGASLSVIDLAGRVVARHDIGSLGEGRHRVDLARDASLRAGLYWIRLQHGDAARSAKVAIVP